jgi:hypothetical protein
VLEGRGELRVGDRVVAVDHPGAYLLTEHPHHMHGTLELRVGEGVTCHATCFSPGPVPPGD